MIIHFAAIHVRGGRQRLWLLPIFALLSIHFVRPELVAQKQSTAPPVFDASHLYQPVDLDGIWRIRVEENAGQAAEYAQPGYDDSGWIAFNPRDSLHTVFHGEHPHVLWYRLHVKVDPAQTGLGLREETLARAFEVYVNGERLMTSGRLAPYRSYTFNSQILAGIPDRMVATGSLEIALRVGISDRDWIIEFPGLSNGNLTLGVETILAKIDWLEVIGENFASVLNSILTIALGFAALVLFTSQPNSKEYMWIFGLGMMQLAELPIQIVTLFYNIPIGWKYLNASFTFASPFLWAAIYFAFVNVRIGWKFRVFLGIAGILNVYSNLGNQGLVPNLPGIYQLLTNMPFVILLAVVSPIVLGVHWRRGNREAGILLIPAVLFSLYIYANYTLALLLAIPTWSQFAAQGLLLIQRFPAGPFTISLNSVSGIASTLALAAIIVLRSSSASRRQALLEGELEAAREVQQVILPEQIESIPGFAIESIYEPAQQVGGDFFQVIPDGDGGLLLVLGDVAGKGLPAAMLVSVMVGAIRATAEYTHEPGTILASLNERLIGRSRGGFSTAIAAHIGTDGQVAIANAGHLSPYLDGLEIDLPGALPLGILSGASYEAVQLRLRPGSRLTFYSDGVIEAQNEKGELFGFTRGQIISTRPAVAIVEAAKEFGQSDDITVVAITRDAAIAAAA